MNTFECIMRARLARTEDKKSKVFDWDKAASIIKKKGSELVCAYAGLLADFANTTGIIFEDGKVVKDDYCYLASIWDTPVLTLYVNIYYNNASHEVKEEIECWRYEDEVPQWGSNTIWPESALTILNS